MKKKKPPEDKAPEAAKERKEETAESLKKKMASENKAPKVAKERETRGLRSKRAWA